MPCPSHTLWGSTCLIFSMLGRLVSVRTQGLLLSAEGRSEVLQSKPDCIKMMRRDICVYMHVCNQFSQCFSRYQLVDVAFLHGTSPTCSLLLTVGIILLSIFALCVTRSQAARVIVGATQLFPPQSSTHLPSTAAAEFLNHYFTF